MDTHAQTQPIESNYIGPAQLWVGTNSKLIDQVHTYMQQRWCPHRSCMHCITCSQIEQHQYHRALWVEPQGNYTRESLDIIFDTIQFALDENQEMLIVVNRADYLTAACYNSLLKSIEEPPRGYHFLFLAERLDAVSPTIQSRCIITLFTHANSDIAQHQLARYFMTNSYENPTSFIQALETIDPHENESAELIDMILQYWINQYKISLLEGDNKDKISAGRKVISILQHALEEPPMAGSSKLFWKNLFIQIKE